MTKLKVVSLCIASALLAAGLTFSIVSLERKSTVTSLVVTGPSLVNKGGIIQVKASVSNPSWFLNSTIYQWKVLHKGGEVPFETVSPDHIYFPAGVDSDKLYVITSAVNYHNYLLWGNVSPLDTKVTVVNVGDPVPPTPTPVPPVPPTPTPVTTEHLYAIFIHDSAQDVSLSPDQLALKVSQTVQAKLKQLDVSWKIYDKANPALADPKWQAAITKATLPGVFIVDKDGKQYNVGSEKVSGESDVVTKIQSLRGVK